MRIIILIILSLLAFSAEASNYVDKKTGIEIVWQESSNRGGVKVSEMKRKNFERLRDVVIDELYKYPASVLKGKLKRINLVKNVSTKDIKLGGLASGREIYLGRSGKFIMKNTLHHEIAHILYNHYRFPYAQEWNALNPSGFNYVGSGITAIEQGKAHRSKNRKELKKSFITPYAQSAIREDFAELASIVLTGGNEAKKIRRFPTIAKKAAIIKKFYGKISPTLLRYFIY